MNIKSKRICLIGCILSLLLCLIGIVVTTKPQSAKASVVATELSLYPGMSINPTQSNGRLYVSVTADQYAKLNQPDEEYKVLWVTKYTPNPYHLLLYRVKSLDKYYQIQAGTNLYEGSTSKITLEEGESLTFYTKPNNTNIFEYDLNGENYYFIQFPLPTDYTTEYYYFVVFAEYTYYTTEYTGVDGYTADIKNYYYKALDKSTNYYNRSVKHLAEKALENSTGSYSDEQLTILNRMAGISVPSNFFTVNLKYQYMFDYGTVMEVTEQYQVDSAFVLSQEMVASSVFNLAGRTNIYSFNCIYRNGYFTNGVERVTDSKIYLAVDGYTYSYDNASQTGTLMITYKPFEFNDFAIRVRDNDIYDENNLTFYVYFTDLEGSADSDIVTMRLPFESDSVDHTKIGLKNMLYNSLQWMVDGFSASNFSVGTIPEGVNVNITDTELTISFDKDEAYKLANLAITATAEIIPDYDCTVNIRYIKLDYADGNITATEQVKTDNMLYSAYSRNYANSSPFYVLNKEMIDNALELTILDGKDFYVYNGIICSSVGENTFDITVNYSYNTLLKVVTDTTHFVKFYVLDKNSLTYKASEFEYGIPEGYVLSGLSTNDTGDISISYNKEQPLESTVTVNTNTKQNKVLTLTAAFEEEKIDEPNIPEEPDTPDIPDTPDTPDAPDQSGESTDNNPDDTNNGEKPDDTQGTDTEQNSSLKIIVAVIMVALLFTVVYTVVVSSNENKG